MKRSISAVLIAFSTFLACSTVPAWKADDDLSKQYWNEAVAAEAAGEHERAINLAKLSRLHFDQAQRIYLIELQADRNMRAGVAAAAIRAYGEQQSAIIGAESVDDGTGARTVCVNTGYTTVCR